MSLVFDGKCVVKRRMLTLDPTAFQVEPIDRADHLRGQPDALCALWEEGEAIAFSRGRPLLDEQGCLLRQPTAISGAFEAAFFLGLDGARGVFAVEMSQQAGDPGDAPRDLRMAVGRLPDRDGALAGVGAALFGFHHRHRYCGRCGGAMVTAHAGWRRDCPSCGHQTHPRVDPVVILLIEHDNAILLGRQAGWPPGMVSCLAGFVEPAETIEAAARREAMEEAGAELSGVIYLGCQPWPFPGQLMLAMHGKAKSRTVRLNTAELEDARWFTQEECRALVQGHHPSAAIPPRSAIAHVMIAAFARGN
jgi:NAD+ diphosphatase